MRQTISVSDLSGEPSNGAQLRVVLGDSVYVLDVTDEEAKQFANKGKARKRPGRKAAEQK